MSQFIVENNVLHFVDAPPRSSKRALTLSIAKWQFIVNHLETSRADFNDNAERSCGLCMFHYNHQTSYLVACQMCHVAQAGFPHCVHSPYTAYCDAEEEQDTVAMLIAAKAELAFLKSLKDA